MEGKAGRDKSKTQFMKQIIEDIEKTEVMVMDKN